MTLPQVRMPAGAPAQPSLAGRVVLVTGAYGGLGTAVAKAAARAGATVVATGRRKRHPCRHLCADRRGTRGLEGARRHRRIARGG